MRKLGLDLGNKTLGIAVSDELGFLAKGLETFRFEDRDFEKALHYTVNLVSQYNISEVILGHPKNMDGTIGEQGKIAEEFKKDLSNKVTIPIILWDERLTSRMASNMMKAQNLKQKQRRQDIDKMAAAIILQGYLDSKR